MIYLLVLLLIKAALFALPVHFGIQAYQEIGQLAYLKSDKVMELHYIVADNTGASQTEVIVEMPMRWCSGKPQSIRYRVVTQSSLTERLTLTLHSSPVFNSLGTPVIFEPGGDTAFEKTITVPEDAIEDKIYSVPVVGEMSLRGESGLSQPNNIILTSSGLITHTIIRIVWFAVLCVVTLALAILFFIFVW